MMHACVSRGKLLVLNSSYSERNNKISDQLVGVEHDSEGAAHGSGRQVLLEDGAHNTALAVRCGDLAPDALVLEVGPQVVLLEDVSDALAVVERARLAVLAALDVDESGVLFLRPLTPLEASEDGLGVKSVCMRRRED